MRHVDIVPSGKPPAANPRCVVDLQTGPNFCGTGDGLILAWLAAAEPHNIVLNCTDGKWDCLNCLDIPLLKERLVGSSPTKLFDMEKAERGTRGRMARAADYYGIKSPPKRPALRIPPKARVAAARFWQGRGQKILFCPEVNDGSRLWPYWNELGGLIKGSRTFTYSVCKTFMPKKELTWAFAFAVIDMADVVIGADSAYMHIASITDTTGICIMGPTLPNVFEHAPCIRCVTPPHAGRVCSGCCFETPFNVSICSKGCFELARVTPEMVCEVFSTLQEDHQ